MGEKTCVTFYVASLPPQEPDLVRLMSASEDSSRANTPDLCILSNDIPTSPVDEATFPTEDEEEPGAANGNHPSTPPLNLKINLTQTLTLA